MPGSLGDEALPAGLILAGGRSRRMGGIPKAFAPLAGKPLLQHVIDRVKPQVARLWLSVERPSEELAAFGLLQLGDPEPDAGPLAGLLTALQNMTGEQDWLLLVPCDAPFLPRDLAVKLLECALASKLPGAVVRYGSETQPTFSVWNRDLLQRLEHAVVVERMAGLKQFLAVAKLAVLDWPRTDPPPFYNINDQQALRHAGLLCKSEHGETV